MLCLKLKYIIFPEKQASLKGRSTVFSLPVYKRSKVLLSGKAKGTDTKHFSHEISKSHFWGFPP
jgi:hypothetical protein